MIAMERKFGSAVSYIHDDSCKKRTENEIRQIVKKVSELVYNSEVAKEETA